MSDLAKQLAALPGFRWEGGMLDDQGRRVVRRMSGCGPEWQFYRPDEPTPDLSDAATGGALLGWVARSERFAGAHYVRGTAAPGWCIDLYPRAPDGKRMNLDTYSGDTLAEACARALVAIGEIK